MRKTGTMMAAMMCMGRGMCVCCCCMSCAVLEELYTVKKEKLETFL